MMSYPKVTGSIILKVLIVLSALILVASIFLPDIIWSLETAEEDECQFRMTALVDVQTQWAGQHGLIYCDSLEKIIELVQTDSSFRARCDSVITLFHEMDMEERTKNNLPYRMYYDLPVTVDSIFRCPSSGEFYQIQYESEERYKIVCPTEDFKETLYMFFKKQIVNHGEIDQTQESSWQ